MANDFNILAEALLRNDWKAAIALLKAGVDPNAVGPHGNTLMRNAGETANLRALNLLLRHGADPNQRSSYHSPVDGRRERDFTPLFYARSAAAAKLLLKHGADVIATAEGGLTALMRFASRSNIQVVRVLLLHGADSRRTMKFRRLPNATALDVARYQVRSLEKILAIEDSTGVRGLLKEAKLCCQILEKHEGI
jgi:ankyrin repeat protein